MLLGPHVEIDVPVGTQTRLQVQPARSPALGQKRLHARGLEKGHRPRNLLFVDGGVKHVEAVGLLEVEGRRQGLQGGAANPPPDQARSSTPDE